MNCTRLRLRGLLATVKSTCLSRHSCLRVSLGLEDVKALLVLASPGAAVISREDTLHKLTYAAAGANCLMFRCVALSRCLVHGHMGVYYTDESSRSPLGS